MRVYCALIIMSNRHVSINMTKRVQCSHPNFKLGVFIPPMYKICGYEVKFTGMTFYLEKVIGRNGHGPK